MQTVYHLTILVMLATLLKTYLASQTIMMIMIFILNCHRIAFFPNFIPLLYFGHQCLVL